MGNCWIHSSCHGDHFHYSLELGNYDIYLILHLQTKGRRWPLVGVTIWYLKDHKTPNKNQTSLLGIPIPNDISKSGFCASFVYEIINFLSTDVQKTKGQPLEHSYWCRSIKLEFSNWLITDPIATSVGRWTKYEWLKSDEKNQLQKSNEMVRSQAVWKKLKN